MNRKMIFLNLALLALAATFTWQVRRHYHEMKAHQREVLEQPTRPRPVLAPPSVAPPAPVAPVQYIDVAQRTLFSKDRNPNVVIETPPPPPEPPMPALPIYYGQIGIGDPVIFLSVNGGTQKRFSAGDKVGQFKIISFDRDSIVFEWNNKKIERKLSELKAKEGDQGGQQQDPTTQYRMAIPQPSASGAAGASGAQVKSLSASTFDTSKPETVLGVDRGDGFRGCMMNDPTPAGSVVDGYKKMVTQTMMGKSCYWEKVKQ
jgi:hypothetical protein